MEPVDHFPLLRYFVGWLVDAFRSREDLILENLALRQQLLALHVKRPWRRLGSLDRVFWVALRELWSGWRRSLVIVSPETVVRWHRTGFRLYWGWLSRTRRIAGRKPFSRKVRDLIFRMVAENPTWGAPRIHGELLKLGFDISERSVSRWIKRASKNPDPARRWLVFLRNHGDGIAAMDFRLGLGKDTPSGRAVASASPSGNAIISLPRLGGLHHRYTLAA